MKRITYYQVEIQLAVYPDLPPRMLFTWSTIYRSLIGSGENYSLLTPVISIWILKDCLFPETDDCHLPFLPWNIKHKIVLSSHFGIHVLQLPKWNMAEAGHTEKDRWLYLFKEGVNVDTDSPPEILTTDEMRQAMSVMKDFSENQKNYLLYQSRMDALSVIATWKGSIARLQREKEQVQAEKEQAQAEKEQALKQAHKKEQALKQAQAEKEKLLLLLKKAGIDPESP
ncbi:MAG: Rpn family recombination-promoting nuclease/putative transposase [Desulfobacteraceae bacterium]|nr:Rpn family recombination-promoting nuclease/putative transposase [Desulfobacteraceae bacterium]